MDEYTAIINLDYTQPSSNDYQRILRALEAVGWEYVETSAMAYQGELSGVLQALEILARALATGGTVSALTLQAQRIGVPRESPGSAKPENAFAAILQMPLPSD